MIDDIAALLKKPHHGKPTGMERVAALLAELDENKVLSAPNEFVRALDMPTELFPGIASGRGDLIRVATARAMTADEVKQLFALIAVLVDTNEALRRHAQGTARLVETWAQSFKQLQSLGHQIEHFANFRAAVDNEDGEE